MIQILLLDTCNRVSSLAFFKYIDKNVVLNNTNLVTGKTIKEIKNSLRDINKSKDKQLLNNIKDNNEELADDSHIHSWSINRLIKREES